MLGGGGLVAANVYASATEGGAGGASGGQAPGAATIDCPDVGSRLTTVPDGAKADVDRELALLDQQITEAYQRLQESAQAAQQDAGFVDNSIMNPLKDKRAATIERIAIAIDGAGDRPEGLEALAACTLRASGNETNAGDNGGDAAQNGNGNGGQAGNGPVAADYTDITTVQPNAQNPRQGKNASRGTFTTSCGVNEQGLFNSDNVIVAPGVTNGAHHFHDYIGNQSNDAFASDDDLAAADTSCVDQGDKSTYYWPVLRLQNGTQEQDANAPGGGIEGNAGEIVTPRQVTLTFVGSPNGDVTAMPRLLRIITGDAKAFVNGTANANASWSCTGFEDRQLKDKYPLCPKGSDVVRTFKFQSCWDGSNIDSANHRTHVAFADAAGNCPSGFQAIPQLVQRIVYDVDAPSLQDGGRTTPLFAVDSFPEQLHKPVTDHGDFINVFEEDLMGEMVDCINDGRKCGAGADEGPAPDPTEEPTQQPTDDPTENPGTPPGGNDGQDPGNNDGGQDPGKDNGEQTPPADDSPALEPTGDDAPDAAAAEEPKIYATPTPAQNSAAPAGQGDDSANDEPDTAGTPTQAPADGGDDVGAAPQTEPQAVQGGLADTGAKLWPAAAGAVLVSAGLVLLLRTRRRSM
ncbi:DUF1996 domain-containing protein [Streptomyces dysideae]|uniref:DUF1996 domain-containing protein n=1 Tax=Streptomyces dysideae TaxID=909626 RepID=A0A101URG4_9ACTN|nr:DUF1996 domain-containing protein [Streptomyces dysideae]KUO15483.1 hypothetical protein AQJ91_41075 [Streptomyces dysideae]